MPIYSRRFGARGGRFQRRAIPALLGALIATGTFGIAVAQPVSKVERKSMEHISDVSLSAQHSVSTNDVRIRYTIKNGSAGDIYVLNGMKSWNPGTREPVVLADDYSFFLRDRTEAVVLVGIPPLPKGRLVAVRSIPLATKVASGGSFTQDLRPIPLPLTERSPYMTVEDMERLEATKVQQMSLAVQYLPASAPEIEVASVAYDTAHVAVSTPNTIGDVKEIKVALEQGDLVFRMLPGPR
jgi:hypothetical protein